jgi:penicillin-binding protein 1A
VYYGRGIGELTLAEHAMLAGIPKAPSRNNPLRGPEAGKARRNWILGRMLSLGYIDREHTCLATAAPVTAAQHGASIDLQAQFAAEMARRQMLSALRHVGLHRGLQRVHHAGQPTATGRQRGRRRRPDDLRSASRLPRPRAQAAAEPVAEPATHCRSGRLARDSLGRIAADRRALARCGNRRVDDAGADILFASGSMDRLNWENGLQQARPYISEDRRGAAPSSPSEVLAVGDLIRVSADEEGAWRLGQVPAAQAALVSIDPDDGAIISLVGGVDFALNKFNRATQAQRQPGSNLKPFLYGAALDAGYTAASIINDAPIVMEDSSLEGIWRPENDSGRVLRTDPPALGTDQIAQPGVHSSAAAARRAPLYRIRRYTRHGYQRISQRTCHSPWAPRP